MAAEDKNGMGRTIATAVVGALVGALMMLLLNSRGIEVQVGTNVKDIDDLQRRMLVVEQARAADGARIQAIESKLDDVWKVVVLGERVQRSPR